MRCGAAVAAPPFSFREVPMDTGYPVLPEWQASTWFNTDAAPTLASLRGKVVVIEAFQMLCPGCVSHGLPQAQRVRAAFAPGRVAVIGLHSVFEHHAAMTPVALAAFLHEYRVDFPVAVDAHDGDDPRPATFRAWQLAGTPSLLVLDAEGRLRLRAFGQVDDLRLGALLGGLLAEAGANGPGQACGGPGQGAAPAVGSDCSEMACPRPSG